MLCFHLAAGFVSLSFGERISARWQDADGQWQQQPLEGLLAVCLQHEMDHLDGKLFVDYLSELKRQRIRKKLDKERRSRTA